MIVGIGTDIIEIKRVEEAVLKRAAFLHKYFTKKEIDYFKKRNMRAETIAGNFAAKEAVSKALGTGFRTFTLQDIEIIRDELGAPIVNLYNEAHEIKYQKNIAEVLVSISHCQTYAVAYAVAQGVRNNESSKRYADETNR